MCAILVVEDDEAVCEMMSEWLVQLGHDVHSAHNGVEALESLGRRPPCVIILDLQLPQMDGWELVESLRNDQKLARIPFIVFSAQVREGYDPPVLPAKAFWSKPIELERLETIGRYCQVHQLGS